MKPPVQIILKTETISQSLTRSARAVSESGPDIQPGLIYAVRADNDEGFIIVKCKSVSRNNFDSVILTKISDNSDLIVYKQTSVVKKFDKSGVVTSLISIR